jgi:hypothetical protein
MTNGQFLCQPATLYICVVVVAFVKRPFLANGKWQGCILHLGKLRAAYSFVLMCEHISWVWAVTAAALLKWVIEAIA